MATNEEKETRIEEINEMLSTGMNSHSVDGLSLGFDLASLRKERARITRELNSVTNPSTSSIDISGAFG